MKCELCNEQQADAKCEWGLYERTEPMNAASLCGQCSDVLWKKFGGSVNAGLMHWVNRR